MGAETTGIGRILILLTDGFAISDSAGPSGDPIIICNKCGTAQPD
jgi:hypothetical protein